MLARVRTKNNMKNKPTANPLEVKVERLAGLIEHLIAVEMYRGGAGQKEIAASLRMSVGKVNGLVKGVKAPKENHGNK